MAKVVFVKDLRERAGESLSELFAVSSVEDKTTRAGKPFKLVTLRDRTGEVKGKVWSDFLDQVQTLEEGVVVAVRFVVEEFRGKPDLKIIQTELAQEYEPSDFMLVAPRDLSEMKQELQKRISSVRDYQLRQLLDAFFGDEEFYREFINAPGGKMIHHNYRHGLLEHTLEVLSLLDPLHRLYPQMNRDLITTAVLFHDIGKIYEYETDAIGQVERTADGRLLGHIYIGAQMVRQRMPGDFPTETRRQLLHMILSHQGKLEYGSPVVPSTLEAIAVFHADNLSFELNIARKTISEVEEGFNGEKAPLFSEYNKHLGTQLYVEPDNQQ